MEEQNKEQYKRLVLVLGLEKKVKIDFLSENKEILSVTLKWQNSVKVYNSFSKGLPIYRLLGKVCKEEYTI